MNSHWFTGIPINAGIAGSQSRVGEGDIDVKRGLSGAHSPSPFT